MSKISIRNIARLDLNLLLTFHCLMSERSATRASALLHVTQGAVSSALRRLREHFGDELFLRTPHGMVPTRKAIELAPKITDILTRVSGLLNDDFGFDAQLSDRVFNIAMSDDLEACLAPLMIEAVSRLGYPIRFSFHQTNSRLWRESLADADMDLVICCEPSELGSNYSSSIICSSSYACLYSREASGLPTPLSAEAYFAARHIRVSFDGRRGFIDDLFENMGVTRNVVSSSSHFSGALPVLRRNGLVATFPAFVANLYAELCGLQVCPVPIPVPSFRCFMVWDTTRHVEPHHVWLRGFVPDVAKHLG